MNTEIPAEQQMYTVQSLNVRQLIEKHKELNTPLVLCFLDCKNAFDCVRRKESLECAGTNGWPYRLIASFSNLYADSKTVNRFDNTISKIPLSLLKG